MYVHMHMRRMQVHQHFSRSNCMPPYLDFHIHGLICMVSTCVIHPKRTETRACDRQSVLCNPVAATLGRVLCSTVAAHRVIPIKIATQDAATAILPAMCSEAPVELASPAAM